MVIELKCRTLFVKCWWESAVENVVNSKRKVMDCMFSTFTSRHTLLKRKTLSFFHFMLHFLIKTSQYGQRFQVTSTQTYYVIIITHFKFIALSFKFLDLTFPILGVWITPSVNISVVEILVGKRHKRLKRFSTERKLNLGWISLN